MRIPFEALLTSLVVMTGCSGGVDSGDTMPEPVGVAEQEELVSCSATSVGTPPLTTVGVPYKSRMTGGIFAQGGNVEPLFATSRGVERAQAIKDAGPFVFMAIDSSNLWDEFKEFTNTFGAAPDLNPQMTLVNASTGGCDTFSWAYDTPCGGANVPAWEQMDAKLAAKGMTRADVKVVFTKIVTAKFRFSAKQFEPRLVQEKQFARDFLTALRVKLPNVTMVYLSSRIYAGYSTAGVLSPEPMAYETGWAVRDLIDEQHTAVLQANTSSPMHDQNVPWVTWGPYMWADGTTPRVDALTPPASTQTWLCSDFQGLPLGMAQDGIHAHKTGWVKIATHLDFTLRSSPHASIWYL